MFESSAHRRRAAAVATLATAALLGFAAFPAGSAGAGPSAAAQAPATPPEEPLGAAAPPAAGDPEPSAAQKYFTDVTLVDQRGEQHRFYSDLLAGKTVVINAFFTSCTGVCPVLSGKLAALQERLGDRLESEVRLISLSVDPEHDTPAKLAEYAQRFGARPGWYLLAGDKENVDWALYKVGQYVEDPEAHTNLLIVGNVPAGSWRKVFGLTGVDEISRIVDEVANSGAEAGAGAGAGG
jgi:protein SCO1/2